MEGGAIAAAADGGVVAYGVAGVREAEGEGRGAAVSAWFSPRPRRPGFSSSADTAAKCCAGALSSAGVSGGGLACRGVAGSVARPGALAIACLTGSIACHGDVARRAGSCCSSACGGKAAACSGRGVDVSLRDLRADGWASSPGPAIALPEVGLDCCAPTATARAAGADTAADGEACGNAGSAVFAVASVGAAVVRRAINGRVTEASG